MLFRSFKKPSGGSGPGGPRGPRPNRFQKKENEHNINEDIVATRVRLVGENIEADIYPLEVARRIAREKELDLVEIVPNADPPVCRVVDYKKFLYEKKKKEKEAKAKTAKAVMKEIRFGPNTDEHDFNFKVKHAIKFLEEGAKVKAYVHFKIGRAHV